MAPEDGPGAPLDDEISSPTGLFGDGALVLPGSDGDVPGAGAGADGGDGPPDEPVGDAVEAARSALSRARAAARSKGLRPGLKVRRRTKDVPVDRRSDSGRDPRLLGDQLDQFVAERGWGADVAVGAVIGRWPQIVGLDISRHCEPLDFTDGVLTVRADSTAWATQLRLLSSSLLARLAEDVGEGTVTEIKVIGPGGPSWRHGSKRVQDGRGPRDTYG